MTMDCLPAACVAALAITTAAVGDDLAERLAALEARIDHLQSRTSSDRLTGPRAEAIRGLVAEVLADADTRASLLDSGIEAGWDEGFFLKTEDGDFKLEVSGQVQLRFVYNHQENARDDDDRWGFENRRTKVKFDGYVLDRAVEYSVMGAFDDDDGFFEIQDANIQLRLGEGLKLRLGRARSTLLREELVSSKRQLAVERSLVARTLRQDRSVGFAFKYERDAIQASVGLADTTRELFSDLQAWHVAARLGVLLVGESWKTLKDFTSFPEDEPALAIGVGVLYQDEEESDPDLDDLSFIRWTADVSLEFGGANVFAAVVGNHEDEEGSPTRDQFGVVVHGGFFAADDLELFARYAWGDSDLDEPDMSVVTFGFNRYVARHALKWTTDVGIAFDEVTAFWESGSAGSRADTPGEEGQVVVRSQVQLLF